MSTISDRHTIVPFDAKKSKALDGQRLAKVIYKFTAAMAKKGFTKKQSLCASIPVVSQLDAVTVNAMNPYIVSLYQDAQDGIIKELAGKGRTDVSNEEIGKEQVLQFLADQAAGTRMSTEETLSWYDTNIAELLTVAFAEAMGVTAEPTPEQTSEVAAAIGMYREKFGKMAGGKTKYPPIMAAKMLKALEVAADLENDDIAMKFQTRLVAMKNAPQGADMFGL